MEKLKSFFKTLSGKIVIGLTLGIIVGVILEAMKAPMPEGQVSAEVLASIQSQNATILQIANYLQMLGQIFLNLMNMCVPFLIFGSIVMSVSSLDLKEFKIMGGKTLLLFFVTTAAASYLAVLLGLVLPFNFDASLLDGSQAVTATTLTVKEIILGFFPSNVFVAFTKPIVLQVIIFGCLFGLCMNLLKDNTPGVSELLTVTLAFRSVIMKIITLVMYIAPIGIFGILSSTIAINGLGLLKSLGLVLVYITVVNVLFFVLYTLFISIRYGLSLGMLLKKCSRVIIFAATVTSTALSLPLAMEDTKTLGVKEKISNFILPLGNSLNTNGGPITNVIIAIAAVNLMNIPVGVEFYIMLGLYATIAAFGNPGVIGGALVSLFVVFDLVGLPKEAAVIFFGLDYFYGITRVVLNVMGSIYVSVMVAHSQGEFDKKVFETSLDDLAKQKNTASIS